MSKPLKIVALGLGAVIAIGLAWNVYDAIMGDSRATQERIDGVGGATRELEQRRQQEGQQP